MYKFGMNRIYISLFLLVLTLPAAVQADKAVLAADHQQPAVVAAPLNRGALASYISGHINQLLQDENREPSRYCDDAGCAVVVQ